jgi:glutamyl-tRNA(Gln) amidotransferase subunit D
VKPDFEEKVALLKFHPGFEPKLVEWLLDSGYKGIILEGTGLGHVSHQCFSALKRARDLGVFVGMTSQCLWGRVNMNVYDTGRDLLAQGVVPLGDMLPETALVKLMWALGQTKDYNRLKEIMVSNIAYEISSRSLPPLGDM